MTLFSRRCAFTLLELLVVLAIIGLLLGLLLAAAQKVRDASSRLSCQNRLRQLGLALHQHHDTHSAFPPGVCHYVLPGLDDSDLEPYPLMTWHTRILPYLEQEALWRQAVQAYAQDRYFLNNPPHTARSADVTLFLCPADSPRSPNLTSAEPPPGLTSFLGVQGVTHRRASGMLYLDSQVRLTDVHDGTSNTLLVGERPPSGNIGQGRWYGGWGSWGNADSYLGVRENNRTDGAPLCSPGPYPFQRGRIDDPCSVFHFWSLHTGGANFLLVDGSVRFLPYSAANILPALATREDGEVASVP